MFITTKINKNKALLELVSKHAETLGYKKSSVFADTTQAIWFWVDDQSMKWGIESKPTSSWLVEYDVIDVADFLAIKPPPTELKIGCKIFKIDGDLIDFCGYSPLPRGHETIRKMIEVYEGQPQKFNIFGFKLEVSPGRVVADGEEIKEGIDEFIKWAKNVIHR